jgi:hypothetical protein
MSQNKLFFRGITLKFARTLGRLRHRRSMTCVLTSFDARPFWHYSYTDRLSTLNNAGWTACRDFRSASSSLCCRARRA